MSLSPRSVLITGASRGIGLEFVRQIVTLPSVPDVIIACCRILENAGELQEIAKAHSCVHVLKLDIVNDEEIEQAVKATEQIVGEQGLNLLINNAGIFENKEDGGKLRIQTRDRMRRHYEVNAISPVILSQKFLPLLERAANQNKGSMSANKSAIVMISSILSSQTLSSTSDDYSKENIGYRCSKTALNMASLMISRDLKDSGILVMMVHPGWVRTRIGGPHGELSEEESVSGCLKVMGQAGESLHGRLVNYLGQFMPF